MRFLLRIVEFVNFLRNFDHQFSVQIEVHPLMKNLELLEFCKNRGIVISGYGPQGNISSSAQGWEALKKRLQKNLNLKAGEKINLSKFVKLAMQKKNDENSNKNEESGKKESLKEVKSIGDSTPETTEIPPTPKVSMDG